MFHHSIQYGYLGMQGHHLEHLNSTKRPQWLNQFLAQQNSAWNFADAYSSASTNNPPRPLGQSSNYRASPDVLSEHSHPINNVNQSTRSETKQSLSDPFRPCFATAEFPSLPTQQNMAPDPYHPVQAPEAPDYGPTTTCFPSCVS